MKTNVFFKWIVALSTFLSLATAQGVNEYGMLPCPDGTSNCPPAVYGAPRGDLIRTKDSTNNVVYYQTNLSFSPEVGSYSSFTGNPLDNNGFSSLVYGDYSITGNTIMDFNKKSDLDNSSSYMLTDLNKKYLNSSKASLYLPDSIKPEYIKYATLTWVGSIHKNNLTGQINKQSLVYSCAEEDNIVVRKQDKAKIDHQDLIDVCLNSEFKDSVSCDEVRYKIKNGIYYPNPTNNSNYFNLNNYYKNITYSPNANVNNNFQFSCLEPGRQKMRKTDLKLIDDDVVKNCKDKYNNDKKCNDIFKVTDSGYYTPISYNNKNSKLEFKCTNESYTKIKKENLNKAYYNPKMVQECKMKFPSQASQCDNIINTEYYTLVISYDVGNFKEAKRYDKYILKNQIHYTVKELKEICVKSGNSKEDCDSIDENFNGGIKTFYRLVDEKECKDSGGRFIDYNKCFANNNPKKPKFFGGLDINKHVIKIHSIKVTLGDSHCINNPKDCEEVKACRNYTFSGGNIDIDDYCSKNPESCSEVNTCSRYTYGSQPINLNDFCNKNPAECERVKVCKQYNLRTISSTITPSKEDNRNLASISEKYIKDYNKMNFIAGGFEKEVFAKDEDIDYIFSYNNAQNQGGLWFVYSARADVTDFLKQAIANTKIDRKNKILKFPIAGANVKATDGNVLNSSGSGILGGNGVSFWNNGSFIYDGAKTANFGSWALTVVYDRGSMPSKSSPEYGFYKPKVVTIHNGFASLVHDLQELDSKFLNIVFDGFYTPRQDMYDAKVSTYAVSNANYSVKFENDEAAPFKISKYGDFSNMVNVYNILNNRHSYSGGISMVKPGAHDVEIIDKDLYKSISINTSMLNSTDKQIYMKKEQTRLKFNYGVKAIQQGQGRETTTYAEQTYPSVFAFSTDLYVPDVCYYNTVYNSAGKSSRGDGFVVREGETVKNQVYFTIADNSEAEEASGLKVKAKLSDNIIYSNDTMRIDNTLTETGPNDFIDSELKYMKDNEKGLYEDEEHTNLIQAYKDKQFNKYDGKYLSFFIGDGAGNVNGNNISGGSLNKNKKDKVYVEYKTKVGGYYEEPIFTYDFSLKGVELNYNISMAKCPSPNGKTEWENIVEVVPLDGVKVVNEDYKKRGDYDGLYTQIANKPFNVKVSYDVNITGTSDDDLSRLLSDKEICKLLGYGSECESETFIKEKVGEFNKKRKELSDEINRLNSEISKINSQISKKESEKIIAQNELNKAEANLLEAEQKVKEAQKKVYEAEPGVAKNNAEKDLEAAEKIRDDIKKIRDAADKKVTDLEGEITKLKGDLKKAKDDKSKNESDLGKEESPISDEMSSRIGRLNGVFETTLVSLDEIDRSKCKEAKDNKDLHFNYYQDFTIGQRNFKKDKVDANGQDIKDIMCINEGKFDNFKCDYNDAKKEENKPVKVSQMSKAFPSYQYFTNFDINDKLIDMDNVTIGFARKDYTFIVSYLPSGAERLASCNQECVSRYASEPSATKKAKVDRCQKVCEDKHKPGEIDEKYLEEFRMDVCASDTFAVRPAYFAYDKSQIKDIYTAGDSETLHGSFKDSVYPSDENGNYVLGYDNVLNPADRNSTGVRSTILTTIVPDSCKIDEVNNIIRYDEKIIYQDEKPTNSNILWDKEFDSSNNLLASFEFDKDNKDKNDTERKKYNAITSKNSLEGFKSNSEDLKSYADISLNDLGKLNYYNIGYAKLRLTDHDWTASDKLYTDKTAQSYNYSLEGKDSLGNELNLFGEYIGFKERDKDTSKLKSMIGEYVATKHNIIDQDIILKFKHGKVMVSVLGIRDAIAKTDPFDSNKSKLYTYTFFNSDSEEMGASLDMNVTASLTNADICIKGKCNEKGDKGTYQKIEIYPTLYHDGCYARDVEFGLDFAFDCNKTASDERCKPTVKNRGKEFSCSEHTFHSSCYKPIEGSSKTGKLKQGLVYSVSGLAKDNNTTTINDKVQAQEKDKDGNKKTVDKPGEIEILIEEQGFKNASYKIPLNFNFVRFAGTNNTLDPKLIYADDFIRSKNVPFEEKDLPTDNKIDSKNVSTKDIKANIVSFKKFNNEISELVGDKTIRRDGNKEKNNGEFPSLDDKSLAIDPSSKATFYYGYINAEERLYKLNLNEYAKGVRVHSMFYYDGEKDDGDKKDKLTDFARKNLPVLYLEKNASANLVNIDEKSGFYTNKFEYYTNEDDIKSDKFVRSYTNPNVTGVGNRSAMKDTDNMYEQLSLGVEPGGTEIVEVNVKPWFVFSETDFGYNNSYNTFRITRESDNLDEVGQDGNWGGTGKVKDGDIVGRYLDNNGSASKGRLKNRDRLENAISW
ncbi:hypothetical protein [Campylobacter ureolyticus]|uniref:hypothetical protein n=1 Tax=Campylobacter ureolyticus TaxID=827 RepID=UPI0022B4E5CC|nr:hypothetical protein [Campylobacter ureolyticus]MCZ6168349.1 hypothetical protein [Campylobacter ureolyticus]